ncbi:MAG: FAD-dependent monooxygenase [Acidobacteriota bacterium]|nr:FAD-dependent monooxygenase [Acidobacteriota bacterium]
MDACDALIVGAGPAGSACAWALRRSGIDTVIIDKRSFPRDKVCGGWITPAVIEELQIDTGEYARTRVLQPLSGFRTGRIGGPQVETDYRGPVSYGIRRCEFDAYLLARSGARVLQDTPLQQLERAGERWIVNGNIAARIVIGAGGHFCPVARFLGADARKETAVAAQEMEFEMTPDQREKCEIRGEMPELFFCADMKGYGWCFRKQDFLNIGLGRLDPRGLPAHVADFVAYLRNAGKIGFDLPVSMLGHAYLLYSKTNRNICDDGMLLIGDAAGLAYSQSGEGIRPAIESGLLAAKAIAAAGSYTREKLEPYRRALAARFGDSGRDIATHVGTRLPERWIESLGRMLLANGWFSRHVVLDRWFLHRNQPALRCSPASV